MAVDVHIGSVETVIEAGEGPVDRRRLLAEILAALRAEREREEAEALRRARDTAAPLRSLGRRL